MVFSDQVMQAKPELDAQTTLNTDVALQSWAVATATEAHLLLESGQIHDARDLLALEVPRFRGVGVRWADALLADERPQMMTAYRFAAPHFKEHISNNRVERIAYISSVDSSLSNAQVHRKKNDAELEFEIFYNSQRNEKRSYQQIVVAEYLDAFSELLARLESLQAFADFCESKGVKSSRTILPGANTEPGIYVLPADE